MDHVRFDIWGPRTSYMVSQKRQLQGYIDQCHNVSDPVLATSPWPNGFGGCRSKRSCSLFLVPHPPELRVHIRDTHTDLWLRVHKHAKGLDTDKEAHEQAAQKCPARPRTRPSLAGLSGCTLPLQRPEHWTGVWWDGRLV